MIIAIIIIICAFVFEVTYDTIRLKKDKTIDHSGFNLVEVVQILIYVLGLTVLTLIEHDWIMLLKATVILFCLRWLVHDIALNLARGLKWNYLPEGWKGTSKFDKFLIKMNKKGVPPILFKLVLLGLSTLTLLL